MMSLVVLLTFVSEIDHSDKTNTDVSFVLNLSAMEVNVIRPFVTGGLETFYKLGNPEMIQETERPEHRRPQAADRGPRVSFYLNPMSAKR
ncbi:hypothetical protein Tco_0490195 [Tanacetum coccineum]